MLYKSSMAETSEKLFNPIKVFRENGYIRLIPSIHGKITLSDDFKYGVTINTHDISFLSAIFVNIKTSCTLTILDIKTGDIKETTLPDQVLPIVKGAPFTIFFPNKRPGYVCIQVNSSLTQYFYDLKTCELQDTKKAKDRFEYLVTECSPKTDNEYEVRHIYLTEWSNEYGSEGTISNKLDVTNTNREHIMWITHNNPIKWSYIVSKYIVTSSVDETRITPIREEFA